MKRVWGFVLCLCIASGHEAVRGGETRPGGAPAPQARTPVVPKVRVAVQYPDGASRIEELPGGGYQHLPAEENAPTADAPLVAIEEFPVDPPAEAAPEPAETVLATLYGDTITREDVLRELWESRGKETFDWMVGRMLLGRELRRHGLSIPEEEVEAGLRAHLATLRLAFPELSRQDDLTRAVSGMAADEYRERTVWVELALRKIIRTAMKPDEEKLRSYFANIQAEFIRPERVKLSQLFIPPHPPPEADGIAGPEDWAVAERQMAEAHSRLRLGDLFAEVARAYGTGGQLSRWVERGELLRELEEPAFSIGTGSITNPIRTGMGYHVLLVEEKRERTVPAFEEVRDEVLARFEEEQFARLAGEFMSRLVRNALDSGGLIIAPPPGEFAAREP